MTAAVTLMDKPPAKVLIVMPLAEQRGGGELMFLQLLEFGRGYGVDWSVAFFCDGPMVQQARNWGIQTFDLRAGRLRHPHRLLAAIWKLWRLILRENISAVLSFMGKAQIYGGAAAAIAGIPAIWYQLSLPDPPNWQDRLASALPSRLVFTCSNIASRAQEKVWPGHPVKTVYPGVQLDRFDPAKLPSPADCRQKLGLPASGPLIVLVGRLQRWKGIHHLIDAMPDILKEYPLAHAVVVGGPHAFEPDHPAELERQIAALNLQDHVTLAGLQHNVPLWMQAADIIVHASENEPFGIVIIEAMALGKPVVAAECAGPLEIITPETDGLLWNTKQPRQLTAAILRYLRDRTSADEVGRRARRRAADFATERYAAQIIDAVLGLNTKAGIPAGELCSV